MMTSFLDLYRHWCNAGMSRPPLWFLLLHGVAASESRSEGHLVSLALHMKFGFSWYLKPRLKCFTVLSCVVTRADQMWRLQTSVLESYCHKIPVRRGWFWIAHPFWSFLHQLQKSPFGFIFPFCESTSWFFVFFVYSQLFFPLKMNIIFNVICTSIKHITNTQINDVCKIPYKYKNALYVYVMWMNL